MSLSSRHWTSGIGALCRHISRRYGIGEGSRARSVCPGSRHLNPVLRGDIHPSLPAAGRIRCPGFSGCAHTEPLSRGISHINLCALGRSFRRKKVESPRRITRKVTGSVFTVFGDARCPLKHITLLWKKLSPFFPILFENVEHLNPEAANRWEVH